ncbi:MAG: hypothetical protein SF029_26185 [bacterium]|nr:hypothetical protein [bacterium]
MIRYNRRNTYWLSVLGIILGVVLLAGATPPAVTATLVALFALALAGSFLDLSAQEQLVQTIQQRSRNSKMSPQAREAVARASNRGGGLPGALTLSDVGVIASQTGSEGLVMRRTRSISKDDDGARPFVTLSVDPSEADRNATVRFEIIDQNGRDLYVHEMKIFLREGEMNILADHHLPLMKNPQVEGMGDWDLRVYLDGHLAGVHNFSLSPSTEERRRRLSGNSGGRYYVTESEAEEEDEDVPMSLEDLLRQQSRNSSSRN